MWLIVDSFPECRWDIFLSHNAEDRDWLVIPLQKRLEDIGLKCWLDRHDYPYGHASMDALKDGILRCRYTIFLVTDASLSQARGWTAAELQIATVLQQNLQHRGMVLQHVILPLYFLDRRDVRLPRTVWSSVTERAVFHQPAGINAIDWAFKQVRDFVQREIKLALDMQLRLEATDGFGLELDHRPHSHGLVSRITTFPQLARLG